MAPAHLRLHGSLAAVSDLDVVVAPGGIMRERRMLAPDQYEPRTWLGVCAKVV